MARNRETEGGRRELLANSKTVSLLLIIPFYNKGTRGSGAAAVTCWSPGYADRYQRTFDHFSSR